MSSPPLTPQEAFRIYGKDIVDWIADYLTRVGGLPVLPPVQPGALKASLPPSAPDHGESMEAILAGFREHIVTANTHWNHPRFFGYFSVSASEPGIAAEMLIAALNVNGMLWKSSPAATELEQVTLDWIRQWLGLPQGWFGLIHDTASMSTLHAIAAARHFADPEVRTRGHRPGMVLYTSAHAHSSVEKCAIGLGIGQDNVRKIAVDANFSLDAGALQAAIEHDLANGLRPFCAVATIGTTSTASVDPVPAVADLCERHGLWLHVDAAYAGPTAILPSHRHHFAGWERAHSIVTNPHKWLFTPIDCSLLYTRRPDVMRAAFSLVPDYLRTEENPDAVNLMDYSLALGRRFRSLKLWFVLRHFGRERVAQILADHCRWASAFAARVQAHPRLELAAPVHFSLVCFRVRDSGDETTRILESINSSGIALLSPTTLNGKQTIRLAIGNLRTTAADLDLVWDRIAALLA